jgi:hypothetical protein
VLLLLLFLKPAPPRKDKELCDCLDNCNDDEFDDDDEEEESIAEPVTVHEGKQSVFLINCVLLCRMDLLWSFAAYLRYQHQLFLLVFVSCDHGCGFGFVMFVLQK